MSIMNEWEWLSLFYGIGCGIYTMSLYKNGILVIVLSVYSILFLMYKWCHYIQSNIVVSYVLRILLLYMLMLIEKLQLLNQHQYMLMLGTESCTLILHSRRYTRAILEVVVGY